MCLGTWSQHRKHGHIDHIRHWMNQATAQDWRGGLQWYPSANTFVETVVQDTGIDARIVTAVLSALSPNNPWDNNKANCHSLVAHYASGGTYDNAPKVSTYNANKEKAWTFLTGHTWSNGRKTTSFVDNITRPLSSLLVTVDIWAVRVWLNNPDFGTKCESCSNTKGKKVVHGPGLTAKDYDTIEAAYVQVASEYGILPLQCQAICWVAMKNHVGR